MKLNFDFQIINLDGKDLPDAHAGKLLGTALASDSKGDPIKFYEWAKKLYNLQEIDLDKSDTQTLKDFIKNSTFPAITKAQLFDAFKNEI